MSEMEKPEHLLRDLYTAIDTLPVPSPRRQALEALLLRLQHSLDPSVPGLSSKVAVEEDQQGRKRRAGTIESGSTQPRPFIKSHVLSQSSENTQRALNLPISSNSSFSTVHPSPLSPTSSASSSSSSGRLSPRSAAPSLVSPRMTDRRNTSGSQSPPLMVNSPASPSHSSDKQSKKTGIQKKLARAVFGRKSPDLVEAQPFPGIKMHEESAPLPAATESSDQTRAFRSSSTELLNFLKPVQSPSSTASSSSTSPLSSGQTSSANLSFSVQSGLDVYRALTDSFCNHTLRIPSKLNLLSLLSGPDDSEQVESYGNYASACTVSSYPTVQGSRLGDPICDRFCVQICEGVTLVAVADGCNWGTKPREAALLASSELVRYVASKIATAKDVMDTSMILLKGMKRAHEKIVVGKEDMFDAGTTTLIGAVIAPLHKEKVENDRVLKWACMIASVGDCSAFIYRSRTHCFETITKKYRENGDVTDCGGRLGPSGDDGGPDLRNLSLYMVLLEENDTIFFTSDGVHDNLDPETLGLSPPDLGLRFPTWSEALSSDPLHILNQKQEFAERTLLDIVSLHHSSTTSSSSSSLSSSLDTSSSSSSSSESESSLAANKTPTFTPLEITSSIIKYALKTTEKTRAYMEATPGIRQPADYKEFPGKMDHTTCVSVKACTIPRHPFPTMTSLCKNDVGLSKFRAFLQAEAEKQRALKLKLESGTLSLDNPFQERFDEIHRENELDVFLLLLQFEQQPLSSSDISQICNSISDIHKRFFSSPTSLSSSPSSSLPSSPSSPAILASSSSSSHQPLSSSPVLGSSPLASPPLHFPLLKTASALAMPSPMAMLPPPMPNVAVLLPVTALEQVKKNLQSSLNPVRELLQQRLDISFRRFQQTEWYKHGWLDLQR